MADLVAQGPSPHQRWRRALIAGQTLVVGRSPELSDWSVPWDDQISRRHFECVWKDRKLHVSRAKTATNPIFYQGSAQKQFVVSLGEHFVVGSTTFRVTDERAQVSLEYRPTATEQTYSADFLRSAPFRHAERQIVALSRLPDLVASAASEQELFVQMISVLLSGIPQANAAAIVHCRDSDVTIVHWDAARQLENPFQPSERLILEAVQSGQNILHVWRDEDNSESGYTQANESDWAFCCPLRASSCRGMAVYVAGQSADPDSHGSDANDLQDDLKFAEIVGSAVGNITEVRHLQRRETSLSQFFSPLVMQALRHDTTAVLEPRETDVTVLFCDLRGFSRQSERLAENLFALLNRVSESLGIVTHHILQQGGVIGDFHGDASMGFWGWPLDQPDMCSRACQVALDVRSAFANLSQYEGDDFADFQIGIGIATGRAVAGRIGTRDQVKVTAFGPVVNIASRLEGLNKLFGSEILIDRATVQGLESQSEYSFRRLGIVRPYGMETTTVEVFQLLPKTVSFSADYLRLFDEAVDAFTAGSWDEAYHMWCSLKELEETDPPRDFLIRMIDHAGRVAPDDWTGSIKFTAK